MDIKNKKECNKLFMQQLIYVMDKCITLIGIEKDKIKSKETKVKRE